MNAAYQLDACALIAFFADEVGADSVTEILGTAEKGECSVFLNKINLLEVYYATWRKLDKTTADEVLRKAIGLPITIVDGLSNEVLAEAARLKVSHRISLADAIALADARIRGAELVTSDHREFDPVEQAERLAFHWIQ